MNSDPRFQRTQYNARETGKLGPVHIGNIVKTVFRDIQRRYGMADLSGPELLLKLREEIKRRGIRRRSPGGVG